MVEGDPGNVIIRTPDQKVKDIQIQIQPTWTVGHLKTHLYETYPGNPKVSSQRLILAGKLLQNNELLNVLFKSYDYKPTLHFVCTQHLPEQSSDTETTVSSIRSTSSSPTNPGDPLAESPASRAAPQIAGNPRWNAHVSQINTWHQQLAHQQGPTAYYEQQHMANALVRRVQAQGDGEQADIPQQAAAQPAPPVAPPADQAEQHDILDIFYLLIRGLFLLALAWNYASPAKFCFMGVLLFYLYLYQSNYIALPAFFTRGQQETTGRTEETTSVLIVLKNALVSFFTSLMPSNENTP